MKRICQLLSCSLVSLVLAGATTPLRGEGEDNPYKIIAERNAFNLKPPAAPPAPVAPPDTTKTDIRFTGLARIGNVKHAYFMVVNSKQPGQFLYYDITESANPADPDRDGGISVLEIDEPAAKVKIKHAGNELTLDFEKNGIKPTDLPVIPGAKPNPVPAGAPITPGAGPGQFPAPTPAPAAPLIISKRNPAPTAANPVSSSTPPATGDSLISNSGYLGGNPNATTGTQPLQRPLRTPPPLPNGNYPQTAPLPPLPPGAEPNPTTGTQVPPLPGHNSR